MVNIISIIQMSNNIHDTDQYQTIHDSVNYPVNCRTVIGFWLEQLLNRIIIW